MTEDEEFEALEQRLNMKETKQPEALRLAGHLEFPDGCPNEYVMRMQAATELRRLHALNQELLVALKTALQAFTEMHHAQTRPDWFTRGREAAVQHEIMWSQRGVEAVRAAIAKAQGASNDLL